MFITRLELGHVLALGTKRHREVLTHTKEEREVLSHTKEEMSSTDQSECRSPGL